MIRSYRSYRSWPRRWPSRCPSGSDHGCDSTGGLGWWNRRLAQKSQPSMKSGYWRRPTRSPEPPLTGRTHPDCHGCDRHHRRCDPAPAHCPIGAGGCPAQPWPAVGGASPVPAPVPRPGSDRRARYGALRVARSRPLVRPRPTGRVRRLSLRPPCDRWSLPIPQQLLPLLLAGTRLRQRRPTLRRGAAVAVAPTVARARTRAVLRLGLRVGLGLGLRV